MRIAIYDNLAQSAYVQAKVFHRNGRPVDLVLDPLDGFAMSDPRWDEVDLELPTDRLESAMLPEVPMPVWIRRTEPPTPSRPCRALSVGRGAVSIPRGLGTAFRAAGVAGARVAARRAWVVRTLREYDVVIAYGFGAALCALAGVACLAETWGGDITILPFIGRAGGEASESNAGALRRAEGALQRLGYDRAKRLLLTDPRFFRYAERLGHSDKSTFLPFLIDTKMYHPAPEPELRRALLGGATRLVFVPARQDWRWKGSDLMLRGFAAATAGRRDVALACAGWGADLEASRELAAELGIAGKVRFLPAAMSKPRLLRHYRAADIVMDQFTVGSYGGAALEAMSCERPLLIHLERARYKAVFAELPPVVNVRTPDEIAAALVGLLDDATARADIGAAARRWMIANHGDVLVERTLALCAEVASRE